MRRISLIEKIKRMFTYKERFLRACIYSFYVQKARIDLGEIGFLPFINEQHNRDWARLKADELINQFKKEGTIAIRYKQALKWANSKG